MPEYEPEEPPGEQGESLDGEDALHGPGLRVARDVQAVLHRGRRPRRRQAQPQRAEPVEQRDEQPLACGRLGLPGRAAASRAGRARRAAPRWRGGRRGRTRRRRRGRVSGSLVMDVHPDHGTDPEAADHHEHRRAGEHRQAHRGGPEQLCVPGVAPGHPAGDEERQREQDVRGEPGFGGERTDLPLEVEALAQRLDRGVEDLGEVAPTSACTRIARATQAKSWLAMRRATSSRPSSRPEPSRVIARTRDSSPARGSRACRAAASSAVPSENPARRLPLTSCSASGRSSANRARRRRARDRAGSRTPGSPGRQCGDRQRDDEDERADDGQHDGAGGAQEKPLPPLERQAGDLQQGLGAPLAGLGDEPVGELERAKVSGDPAFRSSCTCKDAERPGTGTPAARPARMLATST